MVVEISLVACVWEVCDLSLGQNTVFIIHYHVTIRQLEKLTRVLPGTSCYSVSVSDLGR